MEVNGPLYLLVLGARHGIIVGGYSYSSQTQGLWLWPKI